MATRVGRSLAGLGGDGRGRLLAAVAAGWFLVLGMRFVVPGILPTITADFAVSSSAAGFAVTVLWVTYALMQFPAGTLADRLGERALLAAGLLVAGAGLVSYVATPTFALFVTATGVFGLGTGLYGPPRGTILSKTFADNDGAAFGLMLAAGSVGAAVLPAAAAVAVTTVGWRTALGAVAPLFALAAVAVWWALPDASVTATGEGTFREALAGAARAVRNRRVALAVAGATLMLFAFQAATAFLTTYLTEVKTFSQGTAGAVLGALFLVGAAIGAVSVLPLAALPLADGRLAVAALGALVGVRMSIGPVSNAYIIALLPDDVQGTAWGALRTGFFVVGSFGSTVVGVVADAGYFDAAFYGLAAVTAVGAGVYVFLPER
jgi:predicted MFS family arabinose efflux permease